MTCVGVGYDGPEVVYVCYILPLFLGYTQALMTLLAVVKELGHEKIIDLSGDSILVGSASSVWKPRRVSDEAYSPWGSLQDLAMAHR